MSTADRWHDRERQMPEQEHIDLVHRLLGEVFSGGDDGLVDELVSTRFVEHQNGVQGTGPEALRGLVRGLRSSFPDLRLDIEDIVAHGDKVWVRARATGTDTGGVAGRPPTGAKVEIDVIDIVRVEAGRIVEHWGVADRLGMLQQVGVVPAPGRRAA
jgi:predicted ester cyclase